jgi:hypothetical protein
MVRKERRGEVWRMKYGGWRTRMYEVLVILRLDIVRCKMQSVEYKSKTQKTKTPRKSKIPNPNQQPKPIDDTKGQT